MSNLTAGKDVIAYCNKCKLRLSHVIVVMKDENTPGKVTCKTCGDTHAFKENRRQEKNLPAYLIRLLMLFLTDGKKRFKTLVRSLKNILLGLNLKSTSWFLTQPLEMVLLKKISTIIRLKLSSKCQIKVLVHNR